MYPNTRSRVARRCITPGRVVARRRGAVPGAVVVVSPVNGGMVVMVSMMGVTSPDTELESSTERRTNPTAFRAALG